MADNMLLNAGAGGKTLATDEIGGIDFQRVKLVHGNDGVNDGDIAIANPLPVRQDPASTVNAANSSTTPLGISATFTGTYVDVSLFTSIIVSIFADQASATDGVKFQWSSDGTNLDIEATAELAANAGRAYSLSPRAQFFRVVYTNGATGQGAFRLETILHAGSVGPFTRPIDKVIDDTYFAQLTRTVLAAKRNDGNYGNIRSSNGDNLKVSVSELDGIGAQDAGRVFVKNPAGTNMGDATTPVRVDPTGTTSQPVLPFALGRTSNPTPVGDNTSVRVMADDLGRIVTSPYGVRDRVVHNRIVLTTTTETNLLVPGGGGIFLDLVYLAVSNQSASLVRVDIRDSVGGTIRWSLALAANGGGGTISFPVPLTQAAVTNNWTAQLSSSVTSVYITAIAVENI